MQKPGNRIVTSDWTGTITNASQSAVGVNAAAAAAPEPSSLVLCIAGLAALGQLRRRPKIT